jgi:hypothetical protein
MAAALLAMPAIASNVVAVEFARQNPQIAAELGLSTEMLAGLSADTVSLAEAEKLGWIDAAERRLYEGCATPDDLRALGYDEAEARAILDEQEQGRACASSS